VWGIAIDTPGNIYIADMYNQTVRKVDANGIITTVAGTYSVLGYSGDGGPATSAKLFYPSDLAFDSHNNLYIVDEDNYCIRKVDSNGIISTIAGNGVHGSVVEGALATSTSLYRPDYIAIDPFDNIYISDVDAAKIYKVDVNGIITTYIGTGYSTPIGDGGLATNATLYQPEGIITDKKGNLYIADAAHERIRKVSLPLTVTTNTSNINICIGSTATLTASGANTYTWAPATGLSTTSGSVVVANPTVTTTYTVAGAKGDSMGLALSTVTVFSSTLNLAANSYSICNGASQTFTVSGASAYTWSPAAALINANTDTPTTNINTNTIYTVTGNNMCGATSAATVSLIVNQLPTYTLAGNQYTICNGTMQTFTVSGASTYTWSPAAALINVNTANPTANPYTLTVYSVTGTDANGCTNLTPATITVSVKPSPSATFTLTQDIAPHTWDVYPTYPPALTNVSWDWGDGSSPSTTTNPSHTYLVAGSYDICLTVTDTSSCSSMYCQYDAVSRLGNNNTQSSMVYINVIYSTTDIKQVSTTNQLNIYPNPASNKITIDANNILDVKLFDVLGKQITSTKTTDIDVSNFKDGIYFIQVQTKEGASTQKIIIQH
ncbi:MAG: T9SS type A sorting domain-containing protein, partial [Bacteroidia bacterium]